MAPEVKELGELVEMLMSYWKDDKKKDDKKKCDHKDHHKDHHKDDKKMDFKKDGLKCKTKCKCVNQNGSSNQNNVNVAVGDA